MDKFYGKLIRHKNPFDFMRKLVAPICKNKLDKAIINCKECKSCSNEKIASFGNPDANIMIINDMALENEYVNDYFFLMLKESGIDTNDVYVISAISCILKRKNGSNRLPTKLEMENCKHYVRYALKVVEPRLIISMGPTAFEMFKEKGTFESMRNKDNYIYDIKTLVTYSIRNSEKALVYDSQRESDRMLDDIFETLVKANKYIESIKGKNNESNK